jgi:hypothetical protein
MKQYLLSILFLILLSLASVAQIGVTEVAGSQKLVRPLSALWVETPCDKEPGLDGEVFCKYFRFYPDGTVIGVTTSGSPNEIKNWFRRPYVNSGEYRIDGTSITFSLTSPEGTVNYKGVIRGSNLNLDVHSQINGYRSPGVWKWVRPRRTR